MKLLKLSLSNFQGVSHAEFDFSGRSCSIYGDNATGKTTVFNAFTWLLFDKASTGAKNFSPKTAGTHELDYSAEAVIEADDGSQVDLRKVYHEVYKKKRGSVEKEFSGHTTDYYIDGVPTSAGEFADRIHNLVGSEDKMMMLTMPDYFPDTLPWQDRRKTLLEICGDVSAEDVIGNTKELVDAKFWDLLRKPGLMTDSRYSVEEYRKIMMETGRKLNSDLETLPKRIDEATKAMPDLEGLDMDALKKSRDAAETALREAEEAAKDPGSEEAMRDIRTKLYEAKAKLASAKADHLEAESKKNESTNRKIDDLQAQLRNIQLLQYQTRGSISQAKIDIDAMKQRREALFKEYQETAAQVWDDSEAVCPTCHRPYDPEKTEELRESFNLQKAKKLEDINKRGKACSKTEIANLEAAMHADEERLAKLKEDHDRITGQLEELKQTLQKPVDFITTDTFKELYGKVEELQKSLEDSASAENAVSEEKAMAVSRAHEELDSINAKLALFGVAEKQEARIEELKKEQKHTAEAFEESEYYIHLCDIFTKAKVRLLNNRINSRFRTLRFKLFDEQINGGLKDCCEVLIPTPAGALVPYASANNAAKINAGLEVIHTLSEAWRLQIPVFVDNAEAVTHLTEYPDLQIIRLVVSESDKTLRMESDTTAEKAA